MSTIRPKPTPTLVPKDSCPCAGATLDKLLQPAILALLTRRPLHGYVIFQRLADVPGLESTPPDATGIYRHLKSMERRGLLQSSWYLSASGPARRQYRLTSRGRKCLAAWIDTLRTYHTNIGKLEAFAAASLAGRRVRGS